MAREWDPEDIFDVLADKRARQVLVATNIRPRSVGDLANICDGSQSSIYRRVSVLADYDLLAEETKIDADGHHYGVYSTDFDNIDIGLDNEELIVEVDGDRYVEQYPQFE